MPLCHNNIFVRVDTHHASGSPNNAKSEQHVCLTSGCCCTNSTMLFILLFDAYAECVVSWVLVEKHKAVYTSRSDAQPLVPPYSHQHAAHPPQTLTATHPQQHIQSNTFRATHTTQPKHPPSGSPPLPYLGLDKVVAMFTEFTI